MNPKECYNSNAVFDADLLFVELYKQVPSQYELCIESDEMINTSDTDLEPIKKLFKHIDVIKHYGYNDVVDKEDVDNDSDQILEFDDCIDPENNRVVKHRVIGNIVIAGDNKVVTIRHNVVKVQYVYSDKERKNAILFANSVFALCKIKEKENLSATIGLINVSQGDYYTQTSKINRVDLDVAKYYNDDFLPVFEDIKDFLNTKGSGLILLSGKIGSGKTSFIRYLCSNYPHEYIIVPNSIASRMGDPELISFMTDHEDSVFVLEDCEQLLEDRSSNMFNNAISTILNMADGLLSDIMNIKLICTFNADISSIDPALLRKGRCFARYEFGNLCEEKVKALNDEFKLNLPEIKPMTLAEIFNNEQTDYADKQMKLGF